MITKKYYKVIRVSHADSEYFRLKNVSNEVGVFKMVKEGTPSYTPDLYYSTDGVNWTAYDFTTLPEVNVSPGANIYFKGTNTRFSTEYTWDNTYSFSLSKTCEGYGNLCSILNPNPATFSEITTVQSWTFAGCFKRFTTLTKAPDLTNITSIGEYGLYKCFYGCDSLTTVPDLSNLTTVNGNSFSNTFSYCTSLTTGPDVSNVTTVNGNNAFDYCFTYCNNISNVTTPNIQDLTQRGILTNWLMSSGGQATGTKVVNVPTGATIATNSYNGIPFGWTRVDY